MDGRKSYRFTLRWGEATETDDAESRIVEQHTHRPEATEIRAVLPQFTGEIEQIPPLYSAIKVGGRRAYDLARAPRSEEHTSELRSLMRISYAVFCLKKK